MQKETQYLGFRIGKDGSIVDLDKVKVMRQMLQHKCVSEVSSFVHICSYYRRFIPNFSGPQQDIYGKIKSNELNLKPIHYLFYKLTAPHTNWSTLEKEAFAIFYTLQKLEQYLHDAEFDMRTSPAYHGFPSTEQKD